MIRPSPEVAAVARRFIDAIVDRDQATLRNLMSTGDALSMLGSAEEEYWTGAAVAEGMMQHFSEAPKITASEELSSEGYEAGSVGWAVQVRRFTFAGVAAPVVFRSTLIFAMERGSWKLAHRHGSVGRPNPDVHGAEHRILNDLVEQARKGFRLDQREGMASVMFTDIVGSSALAAAMGDRLWSSCVADHFGEVRRIVEAGGGQFVKSLGDGTMSSFAAARGALAAAADIQRTTAAAETEPALLLRIGLHTGDVIQTEDDFFGTVVNKAARIAAAASPGEIRVSDATRLMVGNSGNFAFSDPENVTLKGLEGAHALHRLEWRA